MQNSSFHFDQDGRRLLPASVVAKRLCRSTRMVRYLAERGKLPAFKRGKLWFFPDTAVEYYRKERQHA